MVCRRGYLEAEAESGKQAMGGVLVLAFTAALNPTEIAAITVMLLLPHPERLMVGYWFGAMLCGIVCGLAIVYALSGPAHGRPGRLARRRGAPHRRCARDRQG